MPQIEVCFSPALFHLYKKPDSVVVIVDILRASTSICMAFINGASQIIPVADKNELKQYKEKGCIIAAERDGIKLDFADIGNSPHYFTRNMVAGKILAYSTTNGTQIIQSASDCYAVIIGSFYNLSAIAHWLTSKNKDVIIFCAGWKNKFNIEDTLFAGALTEKLLQENYFSSRCDSAIAAAELWKLAKHDIISFAKKTDWYNRLKIPEVLEDCFKIDITGLIPIFQNNVIQIDR